MHAGKMVEAPQKETLNDSWPVVSLRARIQQSRVEKDLIAKTAREMTKDKRFLMNLYGIEYVDDEEETQWCCNCWHDFWDWWRIINQRYTDWNPFFNDEIRYVSENF